MEKYYWAAIIKSDDAYIILFPDFEEAVSQGYTLAECMDMGMDALSNVVDEYRKSKKDLPTPCSREEAAKWVKKTLSALNEHVAEKDIFYQLFKSPCVDNTPVRVSVSLAKSALEKIDAKAADLGMTRSGLLVAAALAYDA